MAEENKLKIEENARNQVRGYLEVSKQSPKDLCDKIKERTDDKITAPTIYNWFNGSSIKLNKLELIIEQMRLEGYEFNI